MLIEKMRLFSKTLNRLQVHLEPSGFAKKLLLDVLHHLVFVRAGPSVTLRSLCRPGRQCPALPSDPADLRRPLAAQNGIGQKERPPFAGRPSLGTMISA